mmetsp:Transcript_711/g.1319  ORF Transcript_711/g.1319 Transcript_711/m.1319 type:complete len:211 (+) Transcript_711:514-1146(+)
MRSHHRFSLLAGALWIDYGNRREGFTSGGKGWLHIREESHIVHRPLFGDRLSVEHQDGLCHRWRSINSVVVTQGAPVLRFWNTRADPVQKVVGCLSVRGNDNVLRIDRRSIIQRNHPRAHLGDFGVKPNVILHRLAEALSICTETSFRKAGRTIGEHFEDEGKHERRLPLQVCQVDATVEWTEKLVNHVVGQPHVSLEELVRRFLSLVLG